MTTLRVLHVEDEALLRKIVSKALTEAGFEVHSFESVKEAKASGVVSIGAGLFFVFKQEKLLFN